MASVPTDWFYGVFVFHGPDVGTSFYVDGNLAGVDLVGVAETSTDAAGDVVIGRMYTSGDAKYADLTVDEIWFWTQALNVAQIVEN